MGDGGIPTQYTIWYLGELAEWEVSTATTDTAAAQEWPEYNQ